MSQGYDTTQRVPMRGKVEQEGSTPTAKKLADGQYADHWVLSREEREQGFVRPVRESYVHKPELAGPKHPIRELTVEELSEPMVQKMGYTHYEKYVGDDTVTGRYWKAKDLARIERGCGASTRMALPLAETYARDPSFYGSTFCVGCKDYWPVGMTGEFVWDGTDQLVGT